MIFTFISCGTIPKDTIGIKGKYSLDSKEAFGELELLEDFKFKYRYAIGLIDTESEGTWTIKDNNLVLTSYSNYAANKIEVKELETDSTSKLIIRFEDGSPVVMANVIINEDGTMLYTTDNDGKIDFPTNTNIKTLSVYFLGETYNYTVNNGNSFIIKLLPDDLSKTYFNNRLFKLKNNKILDKEYNWKYYIKK